jgi:hypothetical protein
MANFKTTIFHSLMTVFLIAACSTSKNKPGDQFGNYSPVSKELYDTIARADSGLFDAFNTRNLDKLKVFFSEDLEFYHDLGGVTNYKQNMEAFERTFLSERKLRRELIKESLEVYPIKDFGAVEMGVHRFYATEKGQSEKLSSEAKFTQLWQNRHGVWKITRIISYGHRENLE